MIPCYVSKFTPTPGEVQVKLHVKTFISHITNLHLELPWGRVHLGSVQVAGWVHVSAALFPSLKAAPQTIFNLSEPLSLK